MSILVTLGFIALLVGVILVICGYTIAPQALRPGWGAIILAIILILIGYLLPYVVTADTHPDCVNSANC